MSKGSDKSVSACRSALCLRSGSVHGRLVADWRVAEAGAKEDRAPRGIPKTVPFGEPSPFPRNPWSSWLAETPVGESLRGFRVSRHAAAYLAAFLNFRLDAAALSVSRAIGSAARGCR